MNDPRDFDVDATVATGANGEDVVLLKLASPTSELNVWLTLAEAALLIAGIPIGRSVPALLAGTSADAPVHWMQGEDRRLYIVVGEDDECWDFGVTLSEPSYNSVLIEVKKCLAAAAAA